MTVSIGLGRVGSKVFHLSLQGCVGLGQSADWLGWVGSHKMDPWTTLCCLAVQVQVLWKSTYIQPKYKYNYLFSSAHDQCIGQNSQPATDDEAKATGLTIPQK